MGKDNNKQNREPFAFRYVSFLAGFSKPLIPTLSDIIASAVAAGKSNHSIMMFATPWPHWFSRGSDKEERVRECGIAQETQD